jgi:hypothetical protein
MSFHRKLVLALDDPAPGARHDLAGWARATAALEGVGRAELEMVDEAAHAAHTRKPPRFHAFVSLWLTPEAQESVRVDLPDRVQWFWVRERLAFDRSARDDEERPWAGIKKTTTWAAADGVERSTWQGRYTNHGALAAVHHATVARYRQNVVLEGSDPSVDAISELWWTNVEDLVERFYRSAEAQQLVAIDTVGFVDASRAHPTVTTHEILRLGGAVTTAAAFL